MKNYLFVLGCCFYMLPVKSQIVLPSMIMMNAPTVVPKPTQVQIGTQIWSTSNLGVKQYANGDAIPEVSDPSIWASLTTGAFCYYNNDPTTYEKYGLIYNNYAATDPRGLAPSGWHIPSYNEWTTLLSFVGGVNSGGNPNMYYGIGGALKATGFNYWDSPNTSATNAYGFNAIGLGQRQPNATFQSMFNEVYYRVGGTSGHFDFFSGALNGNGNDVRYYPTSNARWGMNVKLIRN